MSQVLIVHITNAKVLDTDAKLAPAIHLCGKKDNLQEWSSPGVNASLSGLIQMALRKGDTMHKPVFPMSTTKECDIYCMLVSVGWVALNSGELV